MKKTTKENPLTTFRKLNQARQGAVMKSLKKAQDGIETNDDMINKSGSKGGYKKSLQKYKPWEGPVDLIKPVIEKRPNYMEPTRDYVDPRMNPNYNTNPPAPSNFSKPKALSERISKIKQKKGGSVKRKK